ncbi:heavy metal translocating P-type ATPase [Poseidonocella sedimentorum]|uniref:Cu+-exporting ATPase n=1 Tax=Poseidonocella sedimentorum TaxID=871652 RepID=A0A1I6DDK4_9RHOB|nr:heavy metal translocating P-type ATPase [Poseidonocella sedimentorum]SFR03560.1 Cu+-exporting ATPase [Poseidonocella sedimentorum]
MNNRQTQAPGSHSLVLEGLSCGACAARARGALDKVPGVSEVSVNFADGKARFQAAPDALPAAARALAEAGYPVRKMQIRFAVPDMSCASCAGRIEAALDGAPGVLGVHSNLARREVTVTAQDGVAAPDDLRQRLAQAGYPPAETPTGTQQNGETGKTEAQREVHQAARRAAIAAILTLPVFLIEMGGHLYAPWHHLINRTIGQQTSWLLQGALALAVILGPGRPLFARGIRALWRRAPDMNSLVALGAGAAFGYSAVATALPELLPASARAVYFEAAAVIVTLILIGRYLEARARGRTGDALRGLLDLRPQTARVLEGARVVERPLGEVVEGDLLDLRPGARVPVDGVVTEGASQIDESMISGEPLPVAKAPGDAVIGGTMNGTGHLRFRATHVGAATVLSRIVRLVDEAQGARLPVQALVDRVTLWFVPAVLLAAVLTVGAWLLFGPEPRLTHALIAGVSVLIIACPCAMGLATPTSIMVGTGRAAELGVLFRQGDALQRLSGVHAVAFDKTGTLTEGRPTVTDVVTLEGRGRAALLASVAALEAQSEHPLAMAFAAASEGAALPEVAEFASETGQGIRGVVGGADLRVGSRAYLEAAGIAVSAAEAETAETLAAQGKTTVFAAMDGALAGIIAVADPIKASSAAAMAALKARGLRTLLLSGDQRATAEAVGTALGVSEVHAGMRPEDKLALLQELRSQGGVAFVGDGINDAPALAGADVGIALGTGTDIAMEAADVVLMSGDPLGVANAWEVSRQSMANIRQNLFWAFGYNVALIPVAAGLFYPLTGAMLSPMLAAGAMALSSVFVLTNALRLRRIRAVEGME